MNELQAALKVALGNTFVMYFKAHSYHWNVEGINFTQYHDFFGGLYEEVYGAVDPIAEHIRAIDAYAPISIADLVQASTVAEDNAKPANIKLMLTNLQNANNEVIDALNGAFMIAQKQNLQGLMNFLADRLDTHAKHAWQIKSSLKAQ